MLVILLLLASLIMFLLAAFGVGGRVNLIALGLACWVASQLLPMI